MNVLGFEPTVVLGIGALATVYLLAASRWRLRLGGPPELDRRRMLLFLTGLLVMVAALLSPLDTLADESSFAAHTVQHLMLTLVMPLFLLAGTPDWMLRPLVRSPRVLSVARALTRPLPAYLMFNGIFAISHVPLIFNFVQQHLALHVGEHLLFMATAAVLWWPILGPLPEVPRFSYPAQLLYVFLQTLGGVAIGSLITLSNQPLYAQYARRAGLWGMTPVMDQQVGGLIMWVGGALYFFGVLAVIFFIWADREGDDHRPAARARRSPPASAGSRPN
jgi:putative membrane protein